LFKRKEGKKPPFFIPVECLGGSAKKLGSQTFLVKIFCIPSGVFVFLKEN